MGDAYILPAAVSGDHWAAFAQLSVAVFQDGSWTEIAPVEGVRAYIADVGMLKLFDGAAWIEVANGAGGGSDAPPETAPIFGVNATADSYNRLVIKSNSLLFSHDDVTPGSGDARQVINKSSDTKTASLVFQDNYSARAECGLSGDDDLHLKVSPDGGSFFEGLLIRSSDGKVSFPEGLATALQVADGGTGAVTGLEALSNLGLRHSLGSMGDDTAQVIDLGGHVYAAAVLVVSNLLSSGPTAFFHTRMATNPSMSTLFSAGHSFTIGTGPLDGTTGTDGSINFRVDEGGKFYVENRRGYGVGYTLYIFR